MINFDFKGQKVTVMGLGLHGGGEAVVRFLASRGAHITVTDKKTREQLAPTLDRLSEIPFRLVAGEHRMEDFANADMVIKNPAAPHDSPYLQASRRIETDISLFLTAVQNPILAVTGSKGKSSVVSALHKIVEGKYPNARLGGNIGASPLTFIDTLSKDAPVILELSSWQLGDLRGRGLLKPKVAVITNIYRDHQNRYQSMDHYIDDKKEIYRGQSLEDYSLFPCDPYGDSFSEESPAQLLRFSSSPLCCGVEGGWLDGNCGYSRIRGEEEEIIAKERILSGQTETLNLLVAGIVAKAFGVENTIIRERTSQFAGIPHRMEYVKTINGIKVYNDSASTIPEAVIAAINGRGVVNLITGGADKELDFAPLAVSLEKTPHKITLLAGSGTDKLLPLLAEKKVSFSGPFRKLEEAWEAAINRAKPGEIMVFSPGSTSFEMYANEFERGDHFREIVNSRE